MTREEKALMVKMELERGRAVMLDDLGRPGFQLIMKGLQDLSDEMLMRYDAATTMDEVMRIQAYRDVVETIIPRILERMMNVDEPAVKWTFGAWLKSAFKGVKKLYSRSWIDEAAQLLFRQRSNPERNDV